jgi:hypothetical protein
VFSNAIIAYGFARLRWPGRDVLFAVTIATMMIPTAVLMVPLGVLSIVWSATDIGAGGLVNPAKFNPNYFNRSSLPRFENGQLAAVWSEVSIWPTAGKGIWVGLFVSLKNDLRFPIV